MLHLQNVIHKLNSLTLEFDFIISLKNIQHKKLHIPFKTLAIYRIFAQQKIQLHFLFIYRATVVSIIL